MRKDLLKELEIKRKLMIQAGIECGLQNPRTIKLSKELDRLMNEYGVQNDHSDVNHPLH